VLPDGRVLVTGGVRFRYAIAFGGRTQALPGQTEARHDIQRLVNHESPVWDDSTQDAWSSSLCPPSMEGHSAVVDAAASYRMVVFGGHDATNQTAGDVYSGTVWQLQRNDGDHVHQIVWKWDSLSTTAADSGIGKPAPRHGHGALLTSTRRMIVFGGRNPLGPLADVWELNLSAPGPAQWTRWTTVPDPVHGSPAARWGHAVAWDAAKDRMLSIGGRDSAGARSDDAWELGLSSRRWRKLPDSGRPRSGCASALSTAGYPRVWLFGGRGATGPLADLMELRLDTDTWRGPLVVASGSPTPPARLDAASYLNAAAQSLVVSGGELADGSLDGALWHIRFVSPGSEPTSLRWVRDTSNVQGAGPRAGYTLSFQETEVIARLPEVYDPNGSTGSLPGATSPLASSAKRLTYYSPPMFVLPSGHALFALGGRAAVLDVASSTWSAIAGASDGGTAGATVQYRPGRVLRCGGFSKARTTETITFDVNDQTTGFSTWTLGRMASRYLHRATLLPTGDVLVSGGVADPYTDVVGQRVPQLWNESAGWSDSTLLAPEPVFRGYHTTATLMPDGRVFTAGGAYSVDEEKGCIYEPPYLFDAAGQLQAQPRIAASPGAVGYGRSFTVTMELAADAGAATAVCLVKPTANTHDANMEQRYVPLTFSYAGGAALDIDSPANASLAPPGDYLLFVMKTAAGRVVPSVARWVRLDPALNNVAVEDRAPRTAWLARPGPNPARGVVRLEFALPHEGPVLLAIHDVAGRLVREVARGTYAAGARTFEWDGRDTRGRPAAPGIYFVRLEAGRDVLVARMAVVR
jgi:hypothetical protein